MKRNRSLKKSSSFSRIPRSLRVWAVGFQKGFCLWALLERGRLCSLKRLRAKRVFLSFLFQDLILSKCLSGSALLGFAIFLTRGKSMLLVSSSLMRSMQLGAIAEQV